MELGKPQGGCWSIWVSQGNMKISLMCHAAADVGRKEQQVEWLY